MTTYIFRRLGQAVPLFFGVVAITFVLIHLAPGDPIYALAGQSGDEGYYALMRAHYGLDRSLADQFAIYLSNVLHGDLGYSYVQKQPVLPLILSRVPATLLLMGPALVLSTALGIWLGVLAATRGGSLIDLGVNALAATLYGVPVFWLGQMLVIIFAAGLQLFPIQGMTTARSSATGLAMVADVAHHLVLPVVALGLHNFPLVARVTRTGGREALAQEFV